MFNLRINDENVELDAKAKLQLSRLILNISDISQRGINITNSLTLPFTNKNDRLTGFPSRLNSNNLAFEQNQRYVLTEQNNIVSVGDVVIRSFDEKKGIKIQLAEGFSFWNTIGEKKMNDLDLFEFDVEFNNTTFNNLSVKTSSPFLWALARNVGVSGETALNNLQYSRPSYRHRILVDQIVSQAGYSIDYTNIFDTTIFDDIGSISNASNFAVTDYKRFFENINFVAGQIDLTNGVLEFQETGNVTENGLDLENQLYKTSYVIKGTVNANFDTTLSIESTLNGDTVTELLSINKGRSFINYKTDEIEIGSLTAFVLSNDILFENVRIYSHINESDIVEIEQDWKGNGQNSILDGYQILTDYNLHFITQKDFFKTIIQQAFLKIDIDELKKVVKLSSFADVLNQNNALDLSGKAQKFPLVKSGKSFGQLNILTYQNEDDLNPDLGVATFVIDNKNAKPSKNFIKISEFSASREVLEGGNTTIDVPIYTITPAERQSVKERIVKFITGTGIPFTAIFSGISFQSIYSEQYIGFINAIKRERVLTIGALLNFNDFRKLQDKPIVYFREFESYFLVLKISGFEQGGITKLNVIKYG